MASRVTSINLNPLENQEVMKRTTLFATDTISEGPNLGA
jgi:hypothetical protein